MATKEKKLSVNAFEKLAKEYGGDEYATITTPSGVEIEVRRYLDMDEMVGFVSSVADNCFFENGTVFYPEMRWIYNTLTVIEAYTNLRLPRDTRKSYALCVRISGLLDKIIAQIDKVQYNEMQRAITLKIEHKNSELAALATQQISQVTSAVDSIKEQFGEIFGGVDSAQINALIKTFGDGTVDEKKILDAIMERQLTGGESDGKAKLGEHKDEDGGCTQDAAAIKEA